MSDELVFQYYAVAFLDLVGQRDALRKFLHVPASDDEIPQFKEMARQSLGKVLELRRGFANFFDGFQRAKGHRLELGKFPPDYHDAIRAAMQTEYVMLGISDSLVIAVPLGGDDECCRAMNSLQLMMFSICGLAASFFPGGLFFRGGLDIGIATLIETNEVYGSALTKAYQLESEVAEYPRLVVGDQFLDFLETVKNQGPKTKAGIWATTCAGSCRKMIVQDTDGRQMLDFLGAEVWTTLGTSLPGECVQNGREFVEREYTKFRKSGNEKLASRYYRLLQYYLARSR